MTTSHDSSGTPMSRPGSAAVSHSNGSVAFSQAGSTIPIFPDVHPSPLPRNRLVKRTSSLRSSTNGSPSPGSRLPLPVFRRPATSHQRSAAMQERLSGADLSDRMSIDASSEDARDHQLRQYFTPRVAADEASFGRKRSWTGIPNPIKRVYPDRKYTPILVSARELVRPAQLEVDDTIGASDEDVTGTRLRLAPSVASSPLPAQTAHFEEAAAPRRSFSIGDLLSIGPQPLWRRPTSSRGTASASKVARRGRSRVTSAPRAPMGSSVSTAGHDSERPAKRRDLTDPQAAQRSIYSSSSSGHPAESQNNEIQLGLGATTPQSLQLPLAESPLLESPFQEAALSPLEQRRLPSATVEFTAARQARTSASHSEITSTDGSDSERRSTGGYSTDYQSDTVYDSFPTRTTRSGSGKRGPPIDTIFDDSPPTYSSGRSTKLHDLLSDGTFPGSEQGTRYRHSTIEEEETVFSTPVRSLRDNSVTSTPSARPGAQQLFLSSPPATSLMPDPDEIDWDAPEGVQDDNHGLDIAQPNTIAASTPHLLDRSLPFRLGGAFARSGLTASTHSTPSRYNNGGVDKANPFDWSEQQPSPSHQDQSPPRPRTVHGKKDPENRSSRQSGRRAPSGMHARSHSVPVVPDLDGKRSVVATKFGTWGVGTKGVTEDWNEDFDFDEAPPPLPQSTALDDKRIDSGHEMFVPKSIREQQDNVVANISLLREWGLLIEELKDLRMRAVALDMLKGPYFHAWQEVDAMIELADQESEEETLQPRRSPPSSPGFDDSAFEDPLPPLPTISNGTRPRGTTVVRLAEQVLAEDEFVLSPTRASPHQTTPFEGFVTRPRKDSEAVARSVIEALQSKRSVSDPTALRATALTKKVPFDTATLRHIVPYVNGLKRKVKEALRETEGLYSSPRRRSPPEDSTEADEMDVDEPAFRSIFNEPQGGSPTASRQRSRRERAAADHDGFDEPFTDLHTDLAQRMHNMTLRS
ncbi:hypothetical protein LTR36_001000 [Oleoguttula mirabilis]|uniref:Uncharacterized protein n=1 Tax=Oleoguttula mirabilis TaxID=1507867 RepID=A0AAV9JPL8_9PEZI|nr:hypothetical protein LTR36_001000 [Oleoguttula mirabilis]